MRRITLAVVLAFSILLAPRAASSQPVGMVRIGYLSLNPRSDTRDAIDAFRAKLRDLGYVEGQNLLIEYRYADGKYERLADLATDLAQLKMNVIFAYGTPAALAAKKATGTTPACTARVGINDVLDSAKDLTGHRFFDV